MLARMMNPSVKKTYLLEVCTRSTFTNTEESAEVYLLNQE